MNNHKAFITNSTNNNMKGLCHICFQSNKELMIYNGVIKCRGCSIESIL